VQINFVFDSEQFFKPGLGERIKTKRTNKLEGFIFAQILRHAVLQVFARKFA
jgi:hypothetical protein